MEIEWRVIGLRGVETAMEDLMGEGIGIELSLDGEVAQSQEGKRTPRAREEENLREKTKEKKKGKSCQ